MNVTRVEQQGQDPRDGQFAGGWLRRRARKAPEAEPEDVAEVHGEADEATFAYDDPDWLDDLA